jgi:hypothetical protein
VVDGVSEFFAQRAGLCFGCARDQDAVLLLHQLGGDADNLFRCFARAENHFGKTSPQPTVCVHLGKAQVNDRGGLKSLQDFIAAQRAGSVSLKEFDRFTRGHEAQSATIPTDGHAGNTSQLGDTTLMVVMMTKQPVSIFEEVPNDDHVNDHDDEDQFRKATRELVYFDGDKKR